MMYKTRVMLRNYLFMAFCGIIVFHTGKESGMKKAREELNVEDMQKARQDLSRSCDKRVFVVNNICREKLFKYFNQSEE